MLPWEIWGVILGFCHPHDAIRLGRVCRRFRAFAVSLYPFGVIRLEIANKSILIRGHDDTLYNIEIDSKLFTLKHALQFEDDVCRKKPSTVHIGQMQIRHTKYNIYVCNTSLSVYLKLMQDGPYPGGIFHYIFRSDDRYAVLKFARLIVKSCLVP